LTGLGLFAIAINFGYSQQQQLKTEDIQSARQRWQQAGFRDYDLRIQIRRHSAVAGDPVGQDSITIEVRGGAVTDGTVNKQPLAPRLYDEYNMPGLFDSIDEFLRRDRPDGKPLTFLKATFDRKDGHLLQFVRRVRGSSERQEIVVVLERR